MKLSEKIQKKLPYRNEIRDIIKKAIITHEISPGDRIVETRWAKLLGVSQAPVREAIRELESMGFIENIPYQGAIVRKVTKKDLIQGYQIRVELDRIGTEQACENITEEEIKELREHLDKMKEAARNKDMGEYISRNVSFHQGIIDGAHNKLLSRLWSQCFFEEWTYTSTEKLTDDLETLAERHELLYDAIVSRDKKRALEETKQHISILMDKILDTQEE